jgi:AraC-like DNA-binding protein
MSDHDHFNAVPSATGGIARLACARAQEAGIELAPLLSESGLTKTQLDNPHTRLKVKNQIRFLGLLADALHDDVLGFHLAREFDLRRIGLLYYVMASSELLADALRRAERYSRIVNEGVSLQFRVGKHATIALRYVGVERHSDRHQVEFWLTTIVRICRHLTSRHLVPSHVKILHRRTEGTSALDAYFERPVQADAKLDEIAFPNTIGQLPINSADSYLNDLLTGYCEDALSQQRAKRETLRPDMENAIALLLPHGKARIGEISRQLGMSRRTLARRLASEGLTFSRIVDELRVELAKTYLKDEGLTVSEIAWLLGYREVSALTHAFKRWFGKTPRAMRASPQWGSRESRSDRSSERFPAGGRQ